MIHSSFAYQYVYDEILNGIRNREIGEDGFLLSEKEYCEKFDVSLTTVRRALDCLKREGIVEKIKGKGTRIGRDVRCVKMRPNRYLGVLMVPFSEQATDLKSNRYNYSNMYAQKIYKSMYNELHNDYDLLIDTIGEDRIAEDFPKSVLIQADKIFLIGEAKREIIEFLHGMGKCVIVYNFFDREVKVCRVNNDEREQYRAAVEHFIDEGHTRIASINGVNNFSESLERYMGYQDAMVLRDLYIDSSYVKWGNMTPDSGYLLAKELLALPEPPTLIVCVNDGVAMGAYDAVEEAGLKVSKDVLLFGHDNSEFRDFKYVFSTIDPRYEEVGKCIADKLKRNTWIDDETIQKSKLIIR